MATDKSPTDPLAPALDGAQENIETKPHPRAPGAEDTGSYADKETPPSARTDELPEKIGKYFVLRLLGKGGFAHVYLAKDPDRDQRLVAIKVPRLRHADMESAIAQFLKETRTASQLQHPRIVKIHDWGRDDRVGCYVVMQYVKGPSLADILKSERLEPRRVCDIVIDVAEALSFMHAQGHVHRDVKPANILVDERAWLSDFGLAFAEDDRWEHAEERAGTPLYMAPEQIRGDAALYRGLGDVWSLGVVLYEGLTGRRPFSGATSEQLYKDIENGIPRPPRDLNPKVPRALERICLRCLEKQPEKRCSMGDVARSMKRWRHGQRLQKALVTAVPLLCLALAAIVFFLPARPSAPSSDSSLTPAAVLSSASSDNNYFRVNEIANTLHMVSDNLYLVRLGRIDLDDAVFRITMKTGPGDGEAGVFIGLRNRAGDGQRQLQRITLAKSADGAQFSKRTTFMFKPIDPSIGGSHSFLNRPVKAALPENCLEAHFAQGQLLQLYWNGVQVENERPAQTSTELLDVTGLFGVYTNKTAAEFSQLTINERKQFFRPAQSGN